MPDTVALHTLGCKLNFSETSTIGKEFLSRGYEIVDFKQKADVYVFNTCSVTENAEKECRQLVRRVLRQNPDAFIIVTGCYAQLRPDEISNIEGVDAVLGSNEKFKLFSILDNFNKKEISCIYVSPVNEINDFGAAHSTDSDSRTRAYFKIQDGCDYKCSFCTIPGARGSSRSMLPGAVLDEFKSLIDNGYKEIILTGVNVGDYGNFTDSSKESYNLYKLLLKMVEINNDFRIRISSIEPNLLTDDIIELTANNEKMCKHFHIPLQSGNPRILKAMRRRYRTEDYKNLVLKLKNRIPDIGIGVDVIVGFPGETEEDFLITYNFLNELPVSYLHVFTYSERPDTVAITLPGSVDVHERKRRSNMLRILSEKKKHKFYSEMSGKELEVLFETERENGIMKGFSSNYVRVKHNYIPALVNKISSVRISGIEDNICSGIITGSSDKDTTKSIDLIAS
jgi:threonylcarbamoyladenosine tRNA methylthiotransferase MtaB